MAPVSTPECSTGNWPLAGHHGAHHHPLGPTVEPVHSVWVSLSKSMLSTPKHLPVLCMFGNVSRSVCLIAFLGFVVRLAVLQLSSSSSLLSLKTGMMFRPQDHHHHSQDSERSLSVTPACSPHIQECIPAASMES